MLAENMRAVAFAWFDLGTAGGWCNKPKLESESAICHLFARLEFVSQIMGNVLNTCGTTGFVEHLCTQNTDRHSSALVHEAEGWVGG